jgi:hypothetical protein
MRTMMSLVPDKEPKNYELCWESPEGTTVSIPYPGKGARTVHKGVPCIEAKEQIGGIVVLYRIFDPEHTLDPRLAALVGGPLVIEQALQNVGPNFVCTAGIAGTALEAEFGLIPYALNDYKATPAQVYLTPVSSGVLQVVRKRD